MLRDDASCGLESTNINTGRKHSGHSSELEDLGAPAVARNKCVAANSLFLLVFSLNGSPRPEPGTEGRLGEPCLLGPFRAAPSLF